MPNHDYLGAAAWCEKEERAYRRSASDCMDQSIVPRISQEDRESGALKCEALAIHAAVASSCVRAVDALASGRVVLKFVTIGMHANEWRAIRLGEGIAFYAPDPLTAITLALTEAGDAK